MSDFNFEQVRRSSFQKWPTTVLDTKTLALTGFYALDKENSVRCQFCQIEIHQLEKDDKIVSRHAIASPYCPLINRHITHNQPISTAALNKALPPSELESIAKRFTSLYLDAEHNEFFETLKILKRLSLSPRPIIHTEECETRCIHHNPENDFYSPVVTYSGTTPKHPLFTNAMVRYRSLQKLEQAHLPLEAYAIAGFFKKTDSPAVHCYHCDLPVTDLGPQDDPWTQHAAWSPNCRHVIDNKGSKFVTHVSVYINVICAVNETSKQSTDSEVLPTTLNCVLCLQAKIGTVFLPCGHSLCCRRCSKIISLTTHRCPQCRDNYILSNNVYFP